jgi:murein DD-endopeptidase MepM/ murein hydrolase activator NlpD
LKLILAVILALFLPGNVQGQVFDVLESKVEQGGVVVFKIAPQYQLSNRCIFFMGKEYLPNMFGDVFIGIDVTANMGNYSAILVECGRGFNLYPSFYEEVEILEKKFPQSRMRRRLVTVNTARRKKEGQEIQNAYTRANSWFERTEGKFIEPLENVDITDQFGRTRIYTNAQTNHGGVDLRAPVGTSVKAVNSGVVLMAAKDFSLEGNMVILDHGSGILSLYLHLSKIDVAQGMAVKKGDTIGLSGATGRVSGPHLHFMIKINRVNVDPLGFIEMINKHIK